MTSPKFPKPVAEGEDGWDLQQRNVEERIEAAIVHPMLGDEGATRVESFRDDADVAAHMLPPEHGYYGLDTHTYRFTVVAQRQFWQWHFRNEERIRQERLAEHDRKTAEFNRKINDRRARVEAAKPKIEIVGEPTMRRNDFGVKVRATAGAGPGPLRYYYFAFRPVELRGQPDHTWTKWRTDFGSHKMPKTEVIYTLEPHRAYDIAVYGGSSHGGVYSDPVTVSMKPGTAREPTPAPVPEPEAREPQKQQLADPVPEPDPVNPERSVVGTWGLAWGKFPGIAPGRHYGEFEEDGSIKLRDGSPGLVTAFFLTDPRTLRVTLAHGTPAEQFPFEVDVLTPAGGEVRVCSFGAPGRAQTFGLGEARDYSLLTGETGILAPGVTSTFAFDYDG